jgi:hypothetical protein
MNTPSKVICFCVMLAALGSVVSAVINFEPVKLVMAITSIVLALVVVCSRLQIAELEKLIELLELYTHGDKDRDR